MLDMSALGLAGDVRLLQDQRHQGIVTDHCGTSPPRLRIAYSRWQQRLLSAPPFMASQRMQECTCQCQALGWSETGRCKGGAVLRSPV